MSEWKEYRLGDIADIKGGKRLPKGVNLVTTPNNHPYIRIRDFDSNKVLELNNNFEYVDNETQKLISRYIANTDYILLSIVGTIGLVAKVGSSLNNANLTENCVKINNLQVIDSDFLYYYLVSSDGQNKIKLGTVGAVQPKLPIKNISDITIPVPSFETQHSIASFLSALDDKIAVNRRICENLEAQAQALFKHWFIDFAPFKNGQFVESELGMIPEGWRVGSPYEYVDFIYGAPYKSNLFNDKKEGLPLIRIRDLKDCSPQFYTPEILPKTEYVKAGDVLAGMDAEFAPYIWKGQKGLLNQRVCKIKPKNASIGRLFCMLLVKPQLLFVQAVKTGTTVSHIGKSDIDRFKVVLPPFEEVVRFSIIGEEILEAIVTLSAENLRLSTLRDTLLPKLMSGQIKV